MIGFNRETIELGLVLGGAAIACALCCLGIARLRSALAEVAVEAAIRPYRIGDLDPAARLARGQLVRRFVRRGLRGYLVVVLGLMIWIAALSGAAGALLWWQRATWHAGPEPAAALGWLPYAPGTAVVTGFGLVLYLLAHDADRRPKLRVARGMRRTLPWSSLGYRDPEPKGELDILTSSRLARSRQTQQDARDQVADLAHTLLPQARRMSDRDLRRTVESAVAFIPRQSGQYLDTDRFGELLTLFDGLFGRLRDDTGHQDIWRIAILRQLIRYTGPNVVPRIFEEVRAREPDDDELDGLGLMPDRRRDDPEEVLSSVLDTAFGRSTGEGDAEGLGLIVDLTRTQRENASESGE